MTLIIAFLVFGFEHAKSDYDTHKHITSLERRAKLINMQVKVLRQESNLNLARLTLIKRCSKKIYDLERLKCFDAAIAK